MNQFLVRVVDYAGLTTWFGPYDEKWAKHWANEFQRWGMEVKVEEAAA